MNDSAVMADSDWLVRYRTTIYLALNGAVFLGAIVGAPLHGVPFGVVVYVCALAALCTLPLLLLRRLNDQHILLALFMADYFLCFGALDLQILLVGTDRLQQVRTEFLTGPELAILLGAAAVLAGSALGGAWGKPGQHRRPVAEWSAASLLVVGFAILVLGTAASLYFQIIVTPSKLGFESARGLASMSPALTFMVMLGQMMLPVGILILAYGYSKFGGVFWTTLIILVVASQVAVGFIEDIKSVAIVGGVLVVMTRTVVTNRVPKGWLVYTVVFLVVAFPIFQAYRAASGERGLDRAQALRQLDKVLESAMAEREKEESGSHQRAETFLERSSVKANVELLFEHVGKDVPYLHGQSLVAIPMAFVPRLVVADKEDLNIGALFGKVIMKSDSGVFISISHLGELYWNFGWAGVLSGMLGVGAVLGFVGAKTDAAQGVTLTRVLILLATVKTLCIGFEGTMPISYVLWMRSMAAIGLMHLIFARSTASLPVKQERASSAVLPVVGPRFPNLLR